MNAAMHIDYKEPIAPWEAVSLPTGCPYCGFCTEWIGITNRIGISWCVSCGTLTLTDDRSRCFRHSPPSQLRQQLAARGQQWVVSPEHEFCFVDAQKAEDT